MIQTSMRKSDVIFNSLNRIYDAKLSGALKETEFSDILISIGDIFANKVKQGKVSNDEIESYESHLTQFLGENKDKFYNHPHKDLDVAAKASLQSIDLAKTEFDKRSSYASPVIGIGSYEKTFRKLG